MLKGFPLFVSVPSFTLFAMCFLEKNDFRVERMMFVSRKKLTSLVKPTQ